MQRVLLSYAAKRDGDSFYSWTRHSLDVAACLKILFEQHPVLRRLICDQTQVSDRVAAQWLVWSALRHDLGKVSKAFQGLIKENDHANYTLRHDTLGWVMWRERYADCIPDALRSTANLLVNVGTGHHGAPTSHVKGMRVLESWPHVVPEDYEYLDAELTEFDRYFPMPDQAMLLKGLTRVTWWVAGAQIVADWVASATEWFPYDESLPISDHFNRSLGRARKAYASIGLIQTSLAAPTRLGEIFRGGQPRPLQALVESKPFDEPSCMVVEDAMGAGKTEAAFIIAGKLIQHGQAERIFWALPTIATANGIYQRLARICPDVNRTLVHGSPIRLHNAETQEIASPWLLGDNRRRLFAPMAAGTVDQVMLSAMRSKFSAIRALGLLGSVLVFDEIHAADGYMLRIIESCIELHAMGGGSVVLLSATLPSMYRNRLIDAWRRGRGLTKETSDNHHYPSLTIATARGVQVFPYEADRRKHVTIETEDTEAGCEQRLVAHSRDGGCAAWVCTTVDQAIGRYERLRMTLGEDRVQLFHSRFAAGHRARIEAQVLERFGPSVDSQQRHGQILVATQVIEQSLDLDFDLLVTDAAPIDLLFQRVGRLHRHERVDRHGPALVVLHRPSTVSEWNADRSNFVYSDLMPQVWKSVHIWESAGRIVLPDDIAPMVAAVYDSIDEETPLGIISDTTRPARGRGELASIRPSAGYKSGAEDWLPETRFPTRESEGSQIVALINQHGVYVADSYSQSTLRIPYRKLKQALQTTDEGPVVNVNKIGSYDQQFGLRYFK